MITHSDLKAHLACMSREELMTLAIQVTLWRTSLPLEGEDYRVMMRTLVAVSNAFTERGMYLRTGSACAPDHSAWGQVHAQARRARAEGVCPSLADVRAFCARVSGKHTA